MEREEGCHGISVFVLFFLKSKTCISGRSCKDGGPNRTLALEVQWVVFTCVRLVLALLT